MSRRFLFDAYRLIGLQPIAMLSLRKDMLISFARAFAVSRLSILSGSGAWIGLGFCVQRLILRYVMFLASSCYQLVAGQFMFHPGCSNKEFFWEQTAFCSGVTSLAFSLRDCRSNG